jgi:hypothetical protein
LQYWSVIFRPWSIIFRPWSGIFRPINSDDWSLKKTGIPADWIPIDFDIFGLREEKINFDSTYRKLPLKNTGVTLKGPDGTVLVTAHWVF